MKSRVFVLGDLKISWWTHVEAAPTRRLPPAEYADALARLHAGLRNIDLTDRNARTLALVTNHDETPDLADRDRALLTDLLRAEFVAHRLARLRATPTRRAASLERARHDQRAALHRIREHVSRAARVRPCVASRPRRHALPTCRPQSVRQLPSSCTGGHRSASLEPRRSSPERATIGPTRSSMPPPRSTVASARRHRLVTVHDATETRDSRRLGTRNHCTDTLTFSSTVTLGPGHDTLPIRSR